MSLRYGPGARHIYPSLVLVQPRKTRPNLTERLLMGRKESNQAKKKKKKKKKVILFCAESVFKTTQKFYLLNYEFFSYTYTAKN